MVAIVVAIIGAAGAVVAAVVSGHYALRARREDATREWAPVRVAPSPQTVGMGEDIESGSGRTKHLKLRSPHVIAALIATGFAVVSLIGTGVALFKNGETPTSPGLTTPVQGPSPPPTPSTSSSAPAGTAPSDFYLTDYLEDHPPSVQDDDPIRFGSVVIGGVTYEKSISFGPDPCCEWRVTFELPPGYRALVAKIGRQDGSPESSFADWELTSGDVQLGLGQIDETTPTVTVECDITGLSTLSFRTEHDSKSMSTAFADIRLTHVPAERPSASTSCQVT